MGRRPVLLGALGTLMGATVLFILATSVAWLFVARALQGLATGAALSAASAALLALHPQHDPVRVSLANGVASVAGLFLLLGPELSADLFHTTNHLVAGIGVFALSGSAAAAQLALGRTPRWAGAAGGSLALAAGMVLLVIAAATDSSAVYLVGAVIGGAGFGVAFLGALRALTAVIPTEHRAAVMSAFYVVAYAALSLPAIAGGVVVGSLGVLRTFEAFGSVAAALALVVAHQAWRTRPPARRSRYRVAYQAAR